MLCGDTMQRSLVLQGQGSVFALDTLETNQVVAGNAVALAVPDAAVPQRAKVFFKFRPASTTTFTTI